MAKKSSNSSGLFKQQKKMSAAQLLVFALIFGVVGGLVSWVAFAAPGSGRGKSKYTGSISMVMLNDTNNDGSPNWGETIKFDVTSTYVNNFGPWLSLLCSQNGNIVYSFSSGYGPDYPWTQEFILKSNSWTAGAANCHAELYAAEGRQLRQVTITTLDFRVNE